ncbi:EAL domain-containing protein [Variovorax paradoxus]|uniref:EAL domain-containing protein n=1 Tax=Variovorax paradoxus TaxID=34073 RepID=UPI0019332F2B|nr:EAL domain-containing protein [Variovorax paradoxus]
MAVSREVRRRICLSFVRTMGTDFAFPRDDCCLLWSNESFPVPVDTSLTAAREQLESVLTHVGKRPIVFRGIAVLAQLHADWIEMGSPGELDSAEIELALWTAQQCAEFEQMELDGWGHRYRADMDVAVRTAEALSRGFLSLSWRPVVDVYGGSSALYHSLIATAGPIPEESRSDAIHESVYAPSLERLGLARLWDRHLLRKTLAILRQRPGLRLGIRLSTQSARCDHWWSSVFSALHSEPMLASRLVVEFSASGVVSELEAVRSFCSRLQSLGCRIAVRGLGCRDGDLAIVHACRPDIAKVDPSFLRRARSSEFGREGLQEMLSLAGHLASHAVVDGIEREEDMRLALRAGAQWVEGAFMDGAKARRGEA